jgi:hypothetical protein
MAEDPAGFEVRGSAGSGDSTPIEAILRAESRSGRPGRTWLSVRPLRRAHTIRLSGDLRGGANPARTGELMASGDKRIAEEPFS